MTECLDYIFINIVQPIASTKLKILIDSPTFHGTIIKHVFSIRNKLDYPLVQLRLGHASDNKINKMCGQNKLKDLSTRFTKLCSDKLCSKEFWICGRVLMTAVPCEVMVDTDILVPWKLLHLDSYIMEKLSIRHFNALLIIIDAKNWKLWRFCCPDKIYLLHMSIIF